MLPVAAAGTRAAASRRISSLSPAVSARRQPLPALLRRSQPIAMPPPAAPPPRKSAASRRATTRVRVKQEPGSDDIDSKAIAAEGPRPSSSASISTSSSLLASLDALRAQPELLAIVAVYFVQGLLGLSRLALSYFMKDELQLSAPDVAALTALGFAPWVVKPLYGFLSDALPLAGYRRKSYLALCGVSGAAAWAAMANPFLVSTRAGVLAATLVAAASTACADVVVDSLVVERSRGAGAAGGGEEGKEEGDKKISSSSTETAGNLQSLCWGAAATGGIASAAASGSLVASAGPRAVFAATACFPLLLVAAAGLIVEERIVEEEGEEEEGKGKGSKRGKTKGSKKSSVLSKLADQARALWSAGASSAVLAPALFTFIWQATPTPDSALFFYYTDELGLGPEFMGRVRLAGALASLAGVACYNLFLKKMRLRTVFAGAAVAAALLSSTQLLLVTGASKAAGIPDSVFVLADAAVLSALGQAAFMPVLVLAAKLCPPGVEASLFAALMSVLNGGSAAGSALGGALTSALGVGSSSGIEGGSSAAASAADWSNLPLLVALCSVLSLAPLPLLALVPENMGASEEEGEEEGDGGNGGGGGGGGGETTATAAAKATATKARASKSTKKNPSSSSPAQPRQRRSSSRTRSAVKK